MNLESFHWRLYPDFSGPLSDAISQKTTGPVGRNGVG